MVGTRCRVLREVNTAVNITIIIILITTIIIIITSTRAATIIIGNDVMVVIIFIIPLMALMCITSGRQVNSYRIQMNEANEEEKLDDMVVS